MWLEGAVALVRPGQREGCSARLASVRPDWARVPERRSWWCG